MSVRSNCPHVFAIDTEIGLEWVLNLHTRRHINETATAPDSAIKCCKLVIGGRDDRTEVFLDEIRILFNSSISIKEHNTDFIQFFNDVMVNDFGVVLRTNTGEKFPFSLRDTESIKGLFDVVWYIVPATFTPVRGFNVVVDVIKIELCQVPRPILSSASA